MQNILNQAYFHQPQILHGINSDGCMVQSVTHSQPSHRFSFSRVLSCSLSDEYVGIVAAIPCSRADKPRLHDTTWQPVVWCIQTFNRLSKLSNPFDNRFDNRLYRVNGVIQNHAT